MALERSGVNIQTYNDSFCVSHLLRDYQKKISGDSGVVIGTVDPWLEAMLLENGARDLMTLEYGWLTLDHPRLDTLTPYAFAERYLDGDTEYFDFGATFSSVEHSGLGRYGDPLNPYGDLEAAVQVWCMIKPGGLFFLGVPGQSTSDSYLRWNAARVYGPDRLKHLAANWDVLEVPDCLPDIHVELVLQKPME